MTTTTTRAQRSWARGGLLLLAGITAIGLYGCEDRVLFNDSDLTGRECNAAACGPALGQPNYQCPDGRTTAGPTGRCLEHTDGSCTWEVIQCPGGTGGGDGGSGGGCDYNNQHYADGDSFPSDDGCNTCSCQGGRVACTLRACFDGCIDNGQTYTVGQSFPSADGCNTCTCQAGGQIVCTERACAETCQYNGQTYVVGQSFPSSDGCNTCSCSAGGQIACTERACAPLQYYATCGDPACHGHLTDPSVPPCTPEQMAGAACSTPGETCDPGNDCNSHLVCATSDPTQQPGGCPISRADKKRDIRYLDQAALERVAQELLSIDLATYRYKAGVADGGQARHLGFIIDDVGESASVNPGGQTVNLYGYTSMAVAALKVQAQQIEALKSELADLKKQLAGSAKDRRKK